MNFPNDRRRTAPKRIMGSYTQTSLDNSPNKPAEDFHSSHLHYVSYSILFYTIPICAVLFSSVLLYTQPAGAHHKLGFT